MTTLVIIVPDTSSLRISNKISLIAFLVRQCLNLIHVNVWSVVLNHTNLYPTVFISTKKNHPSCFIPVFLTQLLSIEYDQTLSDKKQMQHLSSSFILSVFAIL